MSLRAVLNYIDTRAKDDADYELYRAIMAEYIAVLATGRRSEKFISYTNERSKIYGDHIEDTRSGSEIIKDTFKKHNLKLAED